MADMTREEAIRRVGILTGYEYDEYLQSLKFAISDMERVEQLEAENKRLKDGIEKVKTRIERYANSDYIFYCCHTDRQMLKDTIENIIKKYLGE